LLLCLILGIQAGSADEKALTLPTLRMAIRPQSERYCDSSEELVTLRLKSKLRFSNTSATPVLLWKGTGQIEYVQIAKSLPDMEAEQYLSSFSITTMGTELGPELSISPMPSSSFVILAPGQTFDIDAEPFLFVARNSSNAEGLQPGKYVIRVFVVTWPETEEIGMILSTRWKEWGALWTQDLLASDPLVFEVARNPIIIDDCP